MPCPDGFYDNGARQLSAKDECAYCPVGVYCKDGRIQDKCSAGYYCDFGAAEKGQGSSSGVSESVEIVVEALELQILFIIDVSDSMDSYRASLSVGIEKIIETVKKDFAGTSFEVGMIGYYDLLTCKDKDENVILDFSTSIGTVGALSLNLPGGCAGSIDVAEDVASALEDGLNKQKLSWKDSAKHLVYLLTDAPAHGSAYWDKTALAQEKRLIHDSASESPAGVIEALIDKYCNDLKSRVYLLDLLFAATGGNYTS